VAVIRESGAVTASADGRASVRPRSREACPRCAAGEGCGAGLNAWLLSDRLDLVDCIYDDGPPQPGETVTMEIEDRSLLIAAALAYGLPLLGLLAGAVLARLGGMGEPGAVLAATTGLLAGGVVARLLARRERIARSLMPRVTRDPTR
jgi:sigma-E factor negative regulatory protein RseC